MNEEVWHTNEEKPRDGAYIVSGYDLTVGVYEADTGRIFCPFGHIEFIHRLNWFHWAYVNEVVTRSNLLSLSQRKLIKAVSIMVALMSECRRVGMDPIADELELQLKEIEQMKLDDKDEHKKS